MPLWAERDGDLVVRWHLMADGAHGQPSGPRCGRSTHRLTFDSEHRWEDLPQRARCADCRAGEGVTGEAPAPTVG